MSYIIKEIFASTTNYGAVRSTGNIKYIVIHYTGNNGDTAQNNGKYFQGANRKASAHYFVDSNTVVRSVPDNRIAWSVGGSKYNNGGGCLYGTAKNANTINIELCDDVKDGTVYPSTATIENALDLVRNLMKQYNIPVSNVIRHYDVNGKLCPAYWVDNNKWESEFHSKISSTSSVLSNTVVSNTTPSSSARSNANSIVKSGQQHAVDFTGHKISVDGIIGTETKKMRARVLQHAINLDYKKGIAEDGIIGNSSKNALGSHYVKKGEKQYMVTAAEILMMLNGINPNGVEYPGIYGNGLVNAAKQKFGGDGIKISASNFLQLM